MSIDHYFDRSMDRADRAVMHIGDARRQLWFSVAILGLCAMLAAFYAPVISASRNAKFEIGRHECPPAAHHAVERRAAKQFPAFAGERGGLISRFERAIGPSSNVDRLSSIRVYRSGVASNSMTTQCDFFGVRETSGGTSEAS